MYKLMVIMEHRPEEYVVTINMYSGEGKLVETKSYEGVKQVVLRAREVSIAKQLSPQPIVLIVSIDKPRIDFKENSLLYIVDEEYVK